MGRRKKGRPVHGWVVLDKPLEMTSTQAVGLMRRLFDAQKAGHAGTLDPLATGLLPIALGEATKTVPFLMDGEKTYRFTVSWGVQTATDDREGEVIARSDHIPTREDVEDALPAFTGEISQVPPQFSAIKVDGERAYDIARDGETVELAARPVSIDALRLVSHEGDESVLECECGKGTYVRSIARDLGLRLDSRAHVSALRRTRVGPLGEADMVSVDAIRAAREALDAAEPVQPEGEARDGLASPLVPPLAPRPWVWDSALLRSIETALDDIPAVAISGADASRLRNGQPILLRGRDAPLPGTAYAVEGRQVVALGEVENGELHPRRIFQL